LKKVPKNCKCGKRTIEFEFFRFVKMKNLKKEKKRKHFIDAYLVTDSTRSTHDFLFKINKPGKMENQNMIGKKKHPGLLVLALLVLKMMCNKMQQII
jgi:hypothetical protein